MPYTSQVQLNPAFSQYMQQRSGQYARQGAGGGAQGLTGYGGQYGGQNFGFPSYGNMWGNMMQSGQQTGVPSGVFGMPSTFYPGQQQQQQQQTQQQATPQSMVQQVAGATDYSQPNINFGDQGQRQSFLDEYKKLYMDQLGSKDKTYQQLAGTAGTLGKSYYDQANAFNAANSGRGAGVIPDRARLAQIQALENKSATANEAKDKYFNNLWKGQQAQLDSLFSGQITPQMLLQGMTRGLLG